MKDATIFFDIRDFQDILIEKEWNFKVEMSGSSRIKFYIYTDPTQSIEDKL